LQKCDLRKILDYRNNSSCGTAEMGFCPHTATTARNTPYRGISAVLLRRLKLFVAVVGRKLDREILRKCFVIEIVGLGVGKGVLYYPNETPRFVRQHQRPTQSRDQPTQEQIYH